MVRSHRSPHTLQLQILPPGSNGTEVRGHPQGHRHCYSAEKDGCRKDRDPGREYQHASWEQKRGGEDQGVCSLLCTRTRHSTPQIRRSRKAQDFPGNGSDLMPGRCWSKRAGVGSPAKDS